MQKEEKSYTTPTLSLCMIVKDEEKNLPECLESVKDVVDEIIVVDTGSIDRTANIAQSFGAQVYHFKWCDDFAAARNESLRHATGDYILWLDADDRIEKSEAKRLEELKKRLPKAKDRAYALELQSPRGGTVEDVSYQTRIFPNLPGVCFEGIIHEQVGFSLQRLGIPFECVPIKVTHYGYSDYKQLPEKAARNLSLLLRQSEKNPSDYVNQFHLAETYGVLGNKSKALEHFKKVIYETNCRDENPYILLAAYLELAKIYRGMCLYTTAQQILNEASQLYPDSSLVKFYLGELYFYMNNYEDALKELSHVKEDELDLFVIPIPKKAIGYLLHCYKAKCYQLLGDQERSSQLLDNLERVREEYEKALQYNPDAVECLFDLGTIYLRSGMLNKAQELLEKTLSLGRRDSALYTNLALVYAKQGDDIKAEQWYQEALRQNPNSLEALTNLGHLYIRHNQLEAAERLFKKVITNGLSNGGQVDIHLALSYIYAQRFELEGCIRECDYILQQLNIPCDMVLESLEDLAKLYNVIGKRLESEGRLAEALLAFRTIVIISSIATGNPQNPIENK
jgi:glycosyltransferase involved in cell wall biosynthesis